MLAIFIGTFGALAPRWLGLPDWLEEQGVNTFEFSVACAVLVFVFLLVDRILKRRRSNL